MQRRTSPTANPRHVFVVGLHRSGTSILAELLKAHPKISGHTIEGMPPELENEGQHVQRVFPPDDALGGPGFFAFNPLSHLTESSALATAESAAQLDAEWGAHWSSDAAFVLEKSPSSMLRMRLLQKLFPDAYFVVILRHPLANAYATQTWGSHHGGKNSLPPDAVVGFVEHWLHAHKVMEADLGHLRQCRVVHLEQLAASPQAVLDDICADLEVETYALPTGKVQAGVNRKYMREWRGRGEGDRARIEAAGACPTAGAALLARSATLCRRRRRLRRRAAARPLVGIAGPRPYGASGRSALERLGGPRARGKARLAAAGAAAAPLGAAKSGGERRRRGLKRRRGHATKGRRQGGRRSRARGAAPAPARGGRPGAAACAGR